MSTKKPESRRSHPSDKATKSVREQLDAEGGVLQQIREGMGEAIPGRGKHPDAEDLAPDPNPKETIRRQD